MKDTKHLLSSKANVAHLKKSLEQLANGQVAEHALVEPAFTSRAKREGYLSGRINGRFVRKEYTKPMCLNSYTDDYHTPSRKARKAEEMEYNKRRWPQKHAIYGGKVVSKKVRKGLSKLLKHLRKK